MGDRVYKPGSTADFDALYRDSHGKILATLVGVLGGDRAEAEDCVQEAFAKAFAAWSRWRPDAPAEAWVHRIAINVAISRRRKARLGEVGELIRRLGRPDTGRDPADIATGRLSAELAHLAVKDAALVVLRHLHGYSNREIAVALGLPESTVGSRLATAKRRLRERLQPGDDFVASVPQGVVPDENQ